VGALIAVAENAISRQLEKATTFLNLNGSENSLFTALLFWTEVFLLFFY
jgi:hypothetical protein